ncbi:MAG: hypothetical protein JSS55_14320 [Proteobacteria bacterium]|nr:hypothetical protein [Pseudomonadota bacterium]
MGGATWLDRRWAVIALVLAMAIPLVWPPLPPLIDVLGHMGRYYVQTHIDRVPALAEAFSFKWRLLGNLGVDLLIEPIGRIFGIELGTKLIVLAVPPLTAAGMLWLAREVHGRVPPTALFALPLAYAFPFQFGFINFSLSVAFALLMLALWVRLARLERFRLRAAIFVPLACLLWLTHTVGWGLFGLGAFGSELARRRAGGDAWPRAILFAGLACLPLALPLLPMLLLRSTSPDVQTFDFFNGQAKLLWLQSLLRDRWHAYDLISTWPIIIVAGLGMFGRHLRMNPLLGIPALLCLIAFLLMPRVTFGSAYSDMRLLPFTFMMALLAIRPVEGKGAQWLAAAGLAFLVIRLAGTTVSYALYDRLFQRELAALDHLPRGSSVLSLVVRPCGNEWSTERLDHLPALAIVRRDAFTNDQWTVDSAQAMQVIKPGVGAFARDPSQLVYPKGCRGEGSDLNEAIATFNRAAFDHVWVLNGWVAAADLQPIWSNGHSTLYRVRR